MIKLIKPTALFALTLIIAACGNKADAACSVAEPFKTMTEEQTNLLGKEKILAMSNLHDKQKNGQPREKDNQRPTIINFWASWCKPCRDELPFLQDISRKKIANVVLINVGDTHDVSINMLTELNINNLQTRAAEDEILSKLKFPGLPVTLIYKSTQSSFIGAGKLKNQKQISNWLNCKN